LQSFQNISTFGGLGASAVTTANGDIYLAIANSISSIRIHNQPVYVMRYTQQFHHFQNISARGAHPIEWFSIDADTFLAIPNYFDDITRQSTTSEIYKLDTASGIFVLNQTFPTIGATYMKPWLRYSQPHMSIVNYWDGYTDTYVFNHLQGQFVNISDGARLYTTGPVAAEVTEIDGTTYMVVSPYSSTDILLYKWNDTQTRFQQTQALTSWGWFYPRFLTINSDIFLTLSDRIVKFCGDQFVLV
jgi:hypothetical protein